MTTIDWCLFALALGVAFPWIVFVTVKLAAYGWLKGCDLFEKEKNSGKKS